VCICVSVCVESVFIRVCECMCVRAFVNMSVCDYFEVVYVCVCVCVCVGGCVSVCGFVV